MAKVKKLLKGLFPPAAVVLYAIFALGLIIVGFAKRFPAFADFWTQKIAVYPRAALAYLTNLPPFSLAESIVLCLPVIIVCLIVLACRKYSGSWLRTGRYIVILFSVAALVYSMLLINFSAAYYGSSLDEKLGIDRRKVSAQELYDTAVILLSETDALADNVDYIYASSSVMPYSLSELNRKLNEAYKKAVVKYPFISAFYSNVKPVALSEPWTYTHIAGVYTFFTGEANLNINFPDYTLPYTAAHEMAHQRGIAREEEANFVAFLVCIESDDAYIRYSAYLNVYEYVASALYKADKELYSSLLSEYLDPRVRHEMIAYNNFFYKYKENVVADVSEQINDSYLHAQGQAQGTNSYGLVVDLAVAYYIPVPEQ